MNELQSVLSDLLSLRASSSQLNNALDRLRGVLTAIALETGLRDGSTITKAGFLQLQESFLHNGGSELSMENLCRACVEVTTDDCTILPLFSCCEVDRLPR